jgi:hypothetical protein
MTFVVGQKWWKFEITEILIRPKPHHHCAKKLQSCGFRIWSGDSNRFYSFQCSTEPVTWGPAASCLAKFKREHHFAAAYSSFISPLGASMCQRRRRIASCSPPQWRARPGQVAARGSTPHAVTRHVPPLHGRTATASHVAHRSATCLSSQARPTIYIWSTFILL